MIWDDSRLQAFYNTRSLIVEKLNSCHQLRPIKIFIIESAEQQGLPPLNKNEQISIFEGALYAWMGEFISGETPCCIPASEMAANIIKHIPEAMEEFQQKNMSSLEKRRQERPFIQRYVESKSSGEILRN